MQERSAGGALLNISQCSEGPHPHMEVVVHKRSSERLIC